MNSLINKANDILIKLNNEQRKAFQKEIIECSVYNNIEAVFDKYQRLADETTNK